MFLSASTIIYAMLMDQLFNEGKLELHFLSFNLPLNIPQLFIN